MSGKQEVRCTGAASFELQVNSTHRSCVFRVTPLHCVQTYYANAKFSVKIKIPLQNTTFGKVIGFKYYSLYVHLQMKFSTSNYFLQITIILSSLHSVCFLLSRDIMQHSNNKCAVQSYFIIFSRL